MPTLTQSSSLHPRMALPSQPEDRSSSTPTIITRGSHKGLGSAPHLPCHTVNSSLASQCWAWRKGDASKAPGAERQQDAWTSISCAPSPPYLRSTPALLLPRAPEPRVGGLATHLGSSLRSRCLHSLVLTAASTACPGVFGTGHEC